MQRTVCSEENSPGDLFLASLDCVLDLRWLAGKQPEVSKKAATGTHMYIIIQLYIYI